MAILPAHNSVLKKSGDRGLCKAYLRNENKTVQVCFHGADLATARFQQPFKFLPPTVGVGGF